MGTAHHLSALDRTLLDSNVFLSTDIARDILDDHGERPLQAQESARVWSHPALKGVELFQGSYRNYEFAPHFHSVPAIGVVDQGAMRFDFNGGTHHIPVGGIILLNPGDVHAPGPAGEHGWGFRVFFLDNALFHTRSLDVTGQVLCFAKPFVQAPELAAALLQLHLKLERQRSSLDAESALLNVLEQLAEMYGVAGAEMPDVLTAKGMVHGVKDYIEAYYPQNISLADLSAAVAASPFHLLRTFRRHVGLTPHGYLIQVRVEAAKKLLRSRVGIADVAHRTGFTDQSHLTRHFKRLTGVTPSRYRP